MSSSPYDLRPWLRTLGLAQAPFVTLEEDFFRPHLTAHFPVWTVAAGMLANARGMAAVNTQPGSDARAEWIVFLTLLARDPGTQQAVESAVLFDPAFERAGFWASRTRFVLTSRRSFVGRDRHYGNAYPGIVGFMHAVWEELQARLVAARVVNTLRFIQHRREERAFGQSTRYPRVEDDKVLTEVRDAIRRVTKYGNQAGLAKVRLYK